MCSSYFNANNAAQGRLTASDLSTKLNEGNYGSSKEVLSFLLASFKGVGFPDRKGDNAIVTLPSISLGGGQ